MKKLLSFLLIPALLLSLATGGALAAGETVVGVKDGLCYENAFLGLRAVFEDGWSLLSDKEAAELMGFAADSLESPALAEQLRESGVVCDLYARAQDGSGDSVNIQLEDLGVLYGVVMGEDAYYEAAIPLLEETLSQAGVAELSVEKETLAFAGGEHVSARIGGTLQGTPLYERLVLVKAGSYMAIVTAFSFDPVRADALLEVFTACEPTE